MESRPTEPSIASAHPGTNLQRSSVAPSTRTSDPQSKPELPTLASAGLGASPVSPKTRKRTLRFDAPPLTGAAALQDEERLREENQKRRNTQLSPNPAMTVVNGLMGHQDGQISKPDHAPRDHASSPPSDNVPAPATVAEPMQIDQATTPSPTSLPGSDEQSHNNHFSSSQSLQAPAARTEHKALTYPPQPPPEHDASISPRGMSLPGSKSSSSKKHKCPHCSTEFTRHHNLKSHLLTHSQEKPFSCQQCHAKFRRLHDLKRHMKLHTGEKPHLCPKCGRKFARGDALARHSKGPGGCAGRRSSIGDDDFPDGASNPEDSMDVDYANGEDDDQIADVDRRKSEPGHRYRKPSLQVPSQPNNPPVRQHSSTFPGVAAMSRGAPPNAQDSGRPTHLSPRISTGSNQGTPQYSLSASSFGGMTDSPRPISPGQTETRRISGSQALPNDERSPNFPQNFHHSHDRTSSQSSPSINLPLPNAHGTHLPSLAGIASDSRTASMSSDARRDSLKTSRPAPIIATHPPMYHQGRGSAASTNNGSISSSHHQSSGGSLREVIGPAPSANTNAFADAGLFEENRKLQDELRQYQVRCARSETRVAELESEVAALRTQQPRPSIHAAFAETQR